MLEIDGLTLRLGHGPLFDGISLRVTRGNRAAIAGRNGQGKSTLMKVIAGLAPYDGGTVTLAKGTTVGYLAQDLHADVADRSAVEEVLRGAGDVRALEAELLRLGEALAHEPHDEKLLAAYGQAQSKFDAVGGYGLEPQVRTILNGLGFTERRMEQPISALSGGWLMRVHLAKLLARTPDLLLLDEPTNHLDIESREWLLDWLGGYDGALLLTSHDRYFLDHLVGRVFELESGQLTIYHGDYSTYEQKRAERIARLQAAQSRQQREIERQQRFIERNRAKAATASNVQSRIKQLAKIERIELPPEPPDIKLRFPEPPSSGQLAFRLTGLGKRYGDLEVFADLTLELPAGEKLAVVGKNGAGKTTLLSILAERIEQTAGTVELGHNVITQVFSQYEDDLPAPDYDLLQAMEEATPPECTVSRRTVLGCFLFSGDDVHKPIRVLSGGERARLKLARMLLKPSNLLILDEPTNHLDLHSKDVLLQALRAFGGTAVFVSHDREFLGALATSVLEIADGRARFFPCDYEQYRWRIAREQQEASAAAAPAAKPKPSVEKAKPQPAKAERKQVKARKQRLSREAKRALRRLEREVEALQEAIEAKEARVAELEALMSEPGFFDSSERSVPVVNEHKALQMEVDLGYGELEAALERLEAAGGE